MRAVQQAGRQLFASHQVVPALTRNYQLELPTSIQNVISGLPGKYALALWNVASKKGQTDAVSKELATLIKGIDEKPKVKQMFEDPTVARTKKSAIMGEALTKMKVSEPVKNFMGILIENKREKLLGKIYEQLASIQAYEKGEVKAIITTAKAMDAQQTKAIRSSLESMLPKGKTLVVEPRVDPRIIGGHIIEVGDCYLDKSYKKRVDELANLIRTVELNH